MKLAAAVLTLFCAMLALPGTARAQTPDEEFYYHADAVGSVRMITDASGEVVARFDHLPFGEAWAAPASPETRRFAGKERDAETGLDYFGARYYSSFNGRFTTVDPVLYIDKALVDPQLWNRYAYVANRPFRFIDPDGQIPVETFADLVSLGSSVWGFVRAPGLAAAGYVAWDAAALALPYVPGSWVRRVAELGYAGLDAAKGAVKFSNAFEAAVGKQYVSEGVGLLAAGDDQVRQVLGLGKGGAAADFLGVTQGGRYVIGEAKGADLAQAVVQLRTTADTLVARQGNVKFTAEIVLRKGQEIRGGPYDVIGSHLVQWNSAAGRWDVVKVQNQVITVRYAAPER
jgi:RHS repeat-associated protein